MTEIDWIICAVLLLSTIVGVMRGVVREVLAIVGWVAGIMLSMSFAGEIADRIPLESLGYLPKVIIASVLILVACLFAVGLFGFIIMLSMSFAGEIADRIPLESLGYLPKVIIASVLILVACLFAVGLFGFILRKMMEVAALSFEDRVLGAVFGFVRGIIVVAACVFLFGLSDKLSSSNMWQQSVMIGPTQTVIDWSMPYMPDWIQALRGQKIQGL